MNKMENDIQAQKRNYSLPLSIVTAAVILAFAWVYTTGLRAGPPTKIESQKKATEGTVLPIKWGELGQKLIETGVIDETKFKAFYGDLGWIHDENLILAEENSGKILNLLWAFGLSNKNRILEEGPMADPSYGGANRFASTGGWTLARGNPMDHYSKHRFVTLTLDEQALVERVAKNIYRPCCDNSTYFPDCNHGMAMLGLLELLASNGVNESEMYRIALTVNSYWFPDTYLTVAKYLESKGMNLENTDPKEILGKNYSSASGYRRILSEITPVEGGGGGSCGV
ncbi:MAG: hypothetical protein HYT13_03310 [Candidatus Liptonbacteria bacterium]|nr:hypothetical protein [Candidatus Liptonbacteria bacterium]